MRRKVSPAERAKLITARKRAYEFLHPETKAGKAQALKTNDKLGRGRKVCADAEAFTKDTARKDRPF